MIDNAIDEEDVGPMVGQLVGKGQSWLRIHNFGMNLMVQNLR
jgi:hypothetical protein